jgi:ubiquinone/menaquinone biosynthesis C-methylase UbiE
MIKRPYEGIRKEVTNVLKPLIDISGSYHATHAKRHARTLEVLLDAGISGKVLELGTSDVIPISLNKLVSGLDIHVTDFNLNNPEVGTLTLKAGEEELNVTSYSVDLESTPIPVEDSTFDYVICSEVIEHMDVDPMYMLSEVNRVLKYGGKLVLTTPSCVGTRAIWKVLRGYEPYFYMQYHKDRNPYRHNYEYSPITLDAVIKAAGFSVNLWTENNFEDPVLEDFPRLEIAGYTYDESMLGDNIFVVGTKTSKVLDRHPSVIYV